MASPGWAHGSANLGDFYSGLSQPIFHLESLLLLLAVGLWVGQTRADSQLAAPLAFAGASLIGGVIALLDVPFPAALWIVRCGALGVGLLVALRWNPPFAGMLGLAIILGGGQGHFAAYLDRTEVGRPLLFALGLGLAPVLVTSWFVALADRFRAVWIQVAFRVVGSWIATIALLVLVLALTQRAP